MKGFEGSSVLRFFVINLLRVFFLNFLFPYLIFLAFNFVCLLKIFKNKILPKVGIEEYHRLSVLRKLIYK